MARDSRTYTLAVVIEFDDGLWHAWCPTLLGYGAATWGATREEALGHLREVVAMIVGRLAEESAPIPTVPDALPAGQVVVVDVPAGEGAGRGPGSFRSATLCDFGAKLEQSAMVWLAEDVVGRNASGYEGVRATGTGVHGQRPA